MGHAEYAPMGNLCKGFFDFPRKVKKGRANAKMPAQTGKSSAQSETYPAQSRFWPRKLNNGARRPRNARAN